MSHKIRNLINNNTALSVMYDAVFFIVLISLSGSLLLPAMMNPTAIQSSVEKHREQLVDETLLMLMTTREPFFEYTFAETQLEQWLGDLYSSFLINKSIQGIFGKQQHHKTYADLCTENMLSQLQVSEHRLNPFTIPYDSALDTHIRNIIQRHTGNKYVFNLSLLWRPIKGLQFGGELYVGDNIPEKNIYVASSYIILPQTSLLEWLNQIQEYIIDVVTHDQELENIGQYLKNFDELNQTLLSENLTRVINKTFHEVFFEGVDSKSIGEKTYNFSGLVTTIINFFYAEIIDSIDNILDITLQGINNLISQLGVDLTDKINDSLLNITNYSFGGGLEELSHNITTWASSHTNKFLTPYIRIFVNQSIDKLRKDLISTPEHIGNEVLCFFYERTNILRAEIRLTLWEGKT
ncbi:MAG: hypothetical protein R6V50_01640 [Thermoplasmatota archaeon]